MYCFSKVRRKLYESECREEVHGHDDDAGHDSDDDAGLSLIHIWMWGW